MVSVNLLVMKIKLPLFGFFMLVLSFIPFVIDAQGIIVAKMDNYYDTAAQDLTVPIKVAGFQNLGSMSLTILFDPAVLTYQGNTAWDSALNAGTYLFNSPFPGKIVFAWFSMFSVSILDTAIVGTLQFHYIQGSTALVFDTVSGGVCEFSDDMGILHPQLYINGYVNGIGPTPTCSNSFSANVGPPLEVSFQATAVNTSPTFGYYWDFGDGTTKCSPYSAAYHVYDNAGSYTVTLQTWSFNFCTGYSSTVLNLSPCILDGDINATASLDTGKVEVYTWLFSPSYFEILDSVEVNGAYSFSLFVSGGCILKAIPVPSSVYYTAYVPTYFGDTPFWTDATTVMPCQSTGPFDIQLVPIIGTIPGFGSIGGTIYNTAKKTSIGLPASGIEILLTSLTNEVLAVCYSDSNGAFVFSSLGYGTYRVRAEITSVIPNPLTITLSDNEPSFNSIIFEITYAAVITGIPPVVTDLSFSLGKVFPIPASDRLSVEIKGGNQGKITIEVYNMLGQIVLGHGSFPENEREVIELNTENLESGIYCLSVKTGTGATVRQNFSICR